MYNVICLKWGTKFEAEYVNKLYAAVKRNSIVNLLFHCFTEDPTDLNPEIKIHPLPYTNVEGWWQKLFLFSDEINIKGRVLFLDLDTLIIDNIDHYITIDNNFVILRDLWARGNNVQSAIMSFEIGKHTKIWNTFIANPESAMQSIRPHGDQRWIQKQQPHRKYLQDLFPNEIVSFKSECRNGVPKGTKLVCFHGKPSIIEAINTTTKIQRFTIPPTPWIKEYWTDE